MEKVTYISDNGLFLVFDEIGPYLLSSIDTMGVGSIEDSDMSIGGIYNTYMSGYDQRSVPMEIAILGGERKGWFGWPVTPMVPTDIWHMLHLGSMTG